MGNFCLFIRHPFVRACNGAEYEYEISYTGLRDDDDDDDDKRTENGLSFPLPFAMHFVDAMLCMHGECVCVCTSVWPTVCTSRAQTVHESGTVLYEICLSSKKDRTSGGGGGRERGGATRALSARQKVITFLSVVRCLSLI